MLTVFILTIKFLSCNKYSNFHWNKTAGEAISSQLTFTSLLNRNTRTRCETYSELTIKAPEWSLFGVVVANFEHLNNCSSASIVDFEQAKASCGQNSYFAQIFYTWDNTILVVLRAVEKKKKMYYHHYFCFSRITNGISLKCSLVDFISVWRKKHNFKISHVQNPLCYAHLQRQSQKHFTNFRQIRWWGLLLEPVLHFSLKSSYYLYCNTLVSFTPYFEHSGIIWLPIKISENFNFLLALVILRVTGCLKP